MKKAPEKTVRGQDADQRERDRRHHDHRREEGAEPADHQHVNQHKHGGESGAEITKDFDRDLPFAIPFQRRFRFGERLDGIVDLHRRAVAAELARVEFRKCLVHFQDRVDGTFDNARRRHR